MLELRRLVRIENFPCPYKDFQVYGGDEKVIQLLKLSNDNRVDIPAERLWVFPMNENGEYTAFISGKLELRQDAMGLMGEWHCV